jgi:FG-GAP-like repeat/Secretion system C-terminal sorting domain/FG-GAP repeat
METFKMKGLFFFVFLLLNIIVFAQPFGSLNVLEKGAIDGQGRIMNADMDGDGNIDVFLADDSGIHWYPNLGDGNWGFQIDVAFNMEYPKCLLSDLNLNGHLDIIVYDFFSDRIGWFLNDGTGEFGDFIEIEIVPGYFSDFKVADIDLDSDNDILFSVYPSKIVYVLENMGSCNFLSSEVLIEIDDNPGLLFCEDLDNDNLPDLTLSFSVNGMVWMKNLGNKNFGPIQVLSSSYLTEISLLDFDMDEDIDILAIDNETFPSKIFWQENDGSGVFERHSIVDSVDLNTHFFSGDFDNDGDMDIGYYSRSLTPGIVPVENIGNDSFVQHPNVLEQNCYYSVAASDFDQDGDADFVLTNAATLRLADNVGGFDFGEPTFLNSHFSKPSDIWSADLNQDGYNECLIASNNFHDLWLFSSNENPGFDMPKKMLHYSGFDIKIDIRDLDLDGWLDVVFVPLAVSSNNGIAWLRNMGDGNYDTAKYISNSYHVSDFDFADFDNDGDLDLIEQTGDGVFHHENVGGGEFENKTLLIDSNNNSDLIAAGDINGDGYEDIVVSNSLSNYKIGYHKNNGDASFSDFILISLSLMPYEISCLDIDFDSDVDILFWDGYHVSILENLDEGDFADPMQIYYNSDRVYSVKLADMDADGNMDMLVGSENILEFLHGKGNCEFNAPELVNSNFDSWVNSEPIDIDKDGDMDIMTNSYYDAQIAWIENLKFTVGSAEITSNEPGIEVFPNPFKMSTRFSFNIPNPKDATLAIFDINGRKVVETMIPASASKWQYFDFNSKDLKPGMYFYSLYNTSSSFKGKIIKM